MLSNYFSVRIYQCQWFYQTSSQVDVCNEVIEEKCVEKEEEKCTNVTNEQCKTVNDEASINFFSIFCTFYQVCENVPEEVCQEVTKEECEKVFVFVFDQFFSSILPIFIFLPFFTIFCVSR